MNHFSYILKLNTLSDSLTDEIYHLQKECEQQKHEEFYMYLDEDGSLYSDIKCFYLFYTEQVLAGFLSFFIEDDTSVCISGCVLPKYRLSSEAEEVFLLIISASEAFSLFLL